GQNVGPARRRISQKISQEDLARRLGVTRESVNKHLRRLEKTNVIVKEAGYLVVTNLAALQASADAG
ncbi:MAG TPA: helix-turn-helix domain-containing protein, partial [Polyangia bacterium]|nr:helix-turn-helix domain-containing protein [Polyangia bacterium]